MRPHGLLIGFALTIAAVAAYVVTVAIGTPGGARAAGPVVAVLGDWATEEAAETPQGAATSSTEDDLASPAGDEGQAGGDRPPRELSVPTGAEAEDPAPGPSPGAPTVSGDAPPRSLPATREEVLSVLIRPARTFVGVSTVAGPLDPAPIDGFMDATGITPVVHQFSRGWAVDEADGASLTEVWDRGQLPVIAWEPWDYTAPRAVDGLRIAQPAYGLDSIIGGTHDDYIDRWAQEIAALDHPVGIRLAHEMNGFWYPWSEGVNDNGPGEYVAMWRHVHARFELAGADQVIWIWSPNALFDGSQPLSEVWPGDDVVDLVGLVAYYGLGAAPPGEVPDVAELFGESVEAVRALTDVPIILTEVGATDLDGQKAAWVDAFIRELPDALPEVRGFLWFEGRASGIDWSLAAAPGAARALGEQISVAPRRWTVGPLEERLDDR